MTRPATINHVSTKIFDFILKKYNLVYLALTWLIFAHMYKQWVKFVSRLTVVSREAKKKQHACASSGPRDHYSELFTRMAALKF